MKTDPQEFDCRTCEVMAQMIGLDDNNAAAWRLYRRLCNRFVNDIEAGSVALDRLTQDLDAEQFSETCERLDLIYGVLQPPKKA